MRGKWLAFACSKRPRPGSLKAELQRASTRLPKANPRADPRSIGNASLTARNCEVRAQGKVLNPSGMNPQEFVFHGESYEKERARKAAHPAFGKIIFIFLVRFVRKIPALWVRPGLFPNSGPDFSYQPTFFKTSLPPNDHENIQSLPETGFFQPNS